MVPKADQAKVSEEVKEAIQSSFGGKSASSKTAAEAYPNQDGAAMANDPKNKGRKAKRAATG